MAEPDYGLTFKCLAGLDPMLTLVRGVATMEQIVLHRLYTPPGGLLSDPTAITIDVREFLSKAILPGDLPVIRAKCQGALLDDERIFEADVEAESRAGDSAADRRLLLFVRGVGSRGPFSLTLSVSALTVSVLNPS